MEYQVVRSRRKTIALEVRRDGEILVRAPIGVSGQTIARFVREHEAWLEQAVRRQQERQDRRPEPSDEEATRLLRLAKEILPEKTAYYAHILGVWPERVTITSARTRFGSCSGKNCISYSWRLMQFPEAAIDYVVVHELCHILHHDHSAAFYACVEKVMPDWRKRRGMLRG